MEIRNTFITFAGQVQKTKKDVKVKSFVRNGKVVRAFDRNQKVNLKTNQVEKNDNTEIAKKIAIGSVATLAGVMGVGIAGAAVVKLRYNKNLIKFGKEIAENKIPVDMSHPKKNYVAPYNIGDKKATNFFIGPLNNRGATGGADLMKSTRIALKDTKLKSEHELIPLFHNYQVSGTGAFGKLDAAIEATKKAAVDGYNMDSVLMAKEIYKWHKLNPTKPINLITHSAGGFQGRDIPHILDAAGVDKKLIRVFSMGSPDYGLVDDIVPVVRAMNNDDIYTNKLFTDKARTKIPSLNRNPTYVGNGYTPKYEEMRYKKTLSEADQTGDYSEVDLPYKQSRAAAHSLGAYLNNETVASKKTVELLKKFIFRD